MSEEINFHSKRANEYGFMSNFWPSPMTIDGKVYHTNEHFYQSMKAVKPEQAEWIRGAPTAYLAMKAGRTLRAEKGELRDKWDEVKFGIMFRGLRAKFEQNPELKAKLMATEHSVLHEDSPVDKIWGKKGLDMLGRMLMHLRAEFRGYDPPFQGDPTDFRRWCGRANAFLLDKKFESEGCDGRYEHPDKTPCPRFVTLVLPEGKK